MRQKNPIQKQLDELNRITGLSLRLDFDDDQEASYHAMEQLQSLILSYKEKNDRNSILKRWITGGMDLHELSHTAKRFHVELTERRVLFLMEANTEIDDSVLAILSNAFPNSIDYWFAQMNANQIALVVTFHKRANNDHLKKLAYLLLNILNTEAMLHVKISYSSIVNHLSELAEAYKKTSITLKVCNIFYPEQNIYVYENLGFGRLIYGLTKEQCISYLEESIGKNYDDILQDETAYTFNCFFDHNLNIAETARQLHMHRNTFIYRLEQIQKITNLDVRQFHDAMTFKTALFVKNYIDYLKAE